MEFSIWRTRNEVLLCTSMATTKRMVGVHMSEAEHALAKQLAERTGESLSVLFRTWLRTQAKKHGLLKA